MKINWHYVSFLHTCGKKGNVIEFLFSRDGMILIEGFCSSCGEDFELEESLLSILAKCTTGDYIQYLTIRKNEAVVIERREKCDLVH